MIALSLALVVSCGSRRDPVLDRMHEDPDWCPSTVDEVESTFNRVECQGAMACGTAYPSQEACEQELAGQQPRPVEGVLCLDGCKLRECILWREEHATDCAADPPDACE